MISSSQKRIAYNALDNTLMTMDNVVLSSTHIVIKFVICRIETTHYQTLVSEPSNRKQFVQFGEIVSQVKPISMGVPQGSVIGPLLFNIVINDIIKSSSKFSIILYADDTTLNSTLDNFVTNPDDIEKAIIVELQNILKWLDVNKLCLNVSKSKFMLFHMPQKVIPCLSFSINGLQIENVHNFNFLGLTINCHLDWKPHLSSIGIKITRVIGLLRKLKYMLPTQVLQSIYNSLILPYMHYALQGRPQDLAGGGQEFFFSDL